jgi:uncharacterized protein involved in exopolysaccharide biosynthesis/LysM repeat protein
MDIAQFIRVIRNNLLLLIAIPLLLGLVVFYFTRNQDNVFESEAIIYTGITTGYSIESTAQRPTDYFFTSAQFDNLINLINSRQTIVEAAIMLYAQNLSLEQYNSQYISNENYDKLIKNTPKYIKDMVVKNGKAGVQREKEEQIRALERELKNLEREINQKRINGSSDTESKTPSSGGRGEGLSKDDVLIHQQTYYYDNNEQFGSSPAYQTSPATSERIHIVKAGETLLSVAKQYGVSMNQLRELNKLSTQELKSGQRIVIERTSPALTVTNTQHKLDSPIPDEQESDLLPDDVYDPNTENWNAFIHQPASQEGSHSRNLNNEMIDQLIEKDPIIPPGIREDDFYKTVQNFTNYYNSNDTNYIYGLLHYGASPHYSIKSLKRLQIYRISNSDLVRLVYTSDDPGICQQTLKIIAHVFVKNYKLLKESQTDMVVDYFRRQVDSADRILKVTEDKLLTFNRKNNIINYPEQTKFIAEQKEELDLYYSNEQVRMAQSAASLRELETKLTRRDSIYLKSDVINQKRKEYADITERILINELAQDYDKRISDEIAILRRRSDILRDEIKLYVDQLYLYSHSTQGLPISRLLDEWLKNALTYEEAKASLVVLARRKLDFVRTYQRFAPLGAILKRIEREMTIAEQTYLELLRSLNLAKMRQQNLQMATNIRIVDPPYFPLQANPSKAKYLVIAAALIGFFLVLFIILLLEYFDASLKSPDRAIEKIGLKLAGAYPYLGINVRIKDTTFVTNRLIEMIIQNLKRTIAMNSVYPSRKPYLILFFSTQEQVGKTLVMSKVANKLRAYGEKVLLLNYNNELAQAEDFDLEQQYQYLIKENFPEVKNLRDLINAQVLRRENTPYDYILLEIPSIVFHSFPMELISQVDAALLVVKANSGWSKADEGALEIFKELSKEPPMVILNQAEDYAIREMISGVKFQRTDSIIQRIKNFLTLPTRIKIQVKEN